MMTVRKKFLCDRITPIQTFKAPDKEAINGALLRLESGATLYLHPCDQCINPTGKLGFLKYGDIKCSFKFYRTSIIFNQYTSMMIISTHSYKEIERLKVKVSSFKIALENNTSNNGNYLIYARHCEPNDARFFVADGLNSQNVSTAIKKPLPLEQMLLTT